ncbi:hypothetical protein FAUST_10151 [Fusarium austroamericanum]|uniref:Uncharacterized protein n=1 Tax=Fusarium austroamericanum TaxID=282268 RepID=A0AAN5Z1D0_FUSAU|nr:hypothetical protein FAUST_10151 [Fusarium austroamericanum]
MRLVNNQLAPNNGEPDHTADDGLESPGPRSSSIKQPGCFLPLSDEDMVQHPELPELNYKPLSLEDGYLVFLTFWFIVCFLGVISLAVFSQLQLPWLHLESHYGYNLWLHSPAIVGFIITVLWRGTLQSYNRIIPYVRMANLPISQDSSGNLSHSGPSFLNAPLTGIPGTMVNFSALLTLWNSRDYLSFASGIFQLVKDKSAMIVYLWLFVVTISVALHLRKNRKGLKWSPSTLAAQLALIQGSNILSKFKDIPTERRWPLDLVMAKWGTEAIIHGVRFLPRTTSQGTDHMIDPNCVSRSESIPDDPSHVRSPEILVDRNQNQNRAIMETLNPIEAHSGNATAALTAAIVAWISGDIYRPFSFPLRHITHASYMPNIIPMVIRDIIFTLLPAIPFGIFNATILNADIYQRTMMPVQNMVKPLPDKDRKRLCPSEAAIKGATAYDSMLLDYITPDLVSCILKAVNAGHYKIVLGTILATLCNSVFIVSGSLFVFSDRDNSGYAVRVQPRNFYAAFSIMIVYCISIWILRPRGAIKTCRPIHTLMDLAMLTHPSHILKCPEFWVQNCSDIEDHLKSQVLLADGLYRFGVYNGMDTHDYVGISICEVPAAWTLSTIDIASLHYSTQSAKDALKFGVYDSSSLSFTQEFLVGGPRTWLKHKGVFSNEHRSWSKRARKLVGRTKKIDSEAELPYDPRNDDGYDIAEGSSSSYHQPSR